MVEFITVADVDTLLPADWAGDGDPELAVLQANAYLNTLTFKAWDEQPDAVTRAGAELAREAANKRLFVSSEGDVKRERVKAGDVEAETEFTEGSRPTTAAMAFVDALLAPWLERKAAWALLRRL
jgi:hypothetical protein